MNEQDLKAFEAWLNDSPYQRTPLFELYAGDAWEAALSHARAGEPVKLRFPTMLRKMWSGGEVQKWIDDLGPLYSAPHPDAFRRGAEAMREACAHLIKNWPWGQIYFSVNNIAKEIRALSSAKED